MYMRAFHLEMKHSFQNAFGLPRVTLIGMTLYHNIFEKLKYSYFKK